MVCCAILLICGVIILALVALKIYFKLRTGWCRSQTCLVGKTIIITGSNTGIGYETALDFAKRGARVILACRDEEKAEKARTTIIKETGNDNIVVKLINMASFESVRAFAKNINATEDRLDVLVNNAGAGGIGDKRSQDGHMLLMQINYFSHVLLTQLLTGLLKKSAPSRVVNVSSLAAKYSNFDLDGLDLFPGVYNVYANSKLCNILFTRELAKRLQGTGVTTYSLHPGAIKTEIFRRVKNSYFFDFIKDNFFKSSVEGAQTTIYTSVARDIEEFNGEHFDNCRRVPPYKTVEESKLSEKLWAKTEEILQLKPEEVQL